MSALTFVLATSGFHAEDAILIVVIALLLAGSGVLAMAETSLVRMNRIKAKSLVDEKKRGARQLARLVENPAKFLNPILLVVLICQLVSATLVGIVAEHLFGALGVLLGIVFEIVVIFVFFEAVPKNWAVQHPSRAALLSAPIVSTLIRFPPIRWLSLVLIGLANRIIGVAGEDQEGIHQTYITDSELKAMADVAHEENVIERDERTFIHSIIDFGDTVAREVMTPRPDMITVEGDVTVRDALEAALAAGYSRIPVEGDGIDDIIGIAYTKDLVRAERVGKAAQMVRESMRPAKFIPESKEVSDLLREMQEEKFHMAVVVDEYGGTAGLITLEDLLEELVGDIVDEFDVEEPTVERFADGSVLVSALYSVDDADDLLGADLPHGPWDTVGGLMLDLVGRVPDKGDSVEVDGFRLTAVDVRGRRIERVRIEPTDSAQDLDGDGDALGQRALRRGGAVRVRGRGRPAQRGQVHPGQPHGGYEGGHHVVAPEHDASPHSGRAARPGGRRGGGVRRHPRHPPSQEHAGLAPQRDGDERAGRRRPDSGDRRRHRGRGPGRPYGARALGARAAAGHEGRVDRWP